MDYLRQLSRAGDADFAPRALLAAKKIIGNLDQVSPNEVADVIHACVLTVSTDHAFEIAGALFKICPDCPLDARRRTLKTLIESKSSRCFDDCAADAPRFSSAVHSLMCVWMSIAIMAPIPIDDEKLGAAAAYACAVEQLIGPAMAGRLLGSIVARDPPKHIAQVSEGLRLTALAKLVVEGVPFSPSWVETELLEASDELSIEDELQLITALGCDRRFCSDILKRAERSGNTRIIAAAGVSLNRALKSSEAALDYIAKELETMGQPSTTHLLANDRLVLFSLISEVSSEADLCSHSCWPDLLLLLITGLQFEHPVNPSRASAIHQAVLKSIFHQVRLCLIPSADLPQFLVQLLRLTLWHTEGLTRHRANSVLQESLGRYGLHQATDLIPNLDSPDLIGGADDQDEGWCQEPQSIGQILADRYLPICQHSPLGFQGCLLSGIEYLLSYEHKNALRHISTIHFLMQRLTTSKTIPRADATASTPQPALPNISSIIDQVVFSICNDARIEEVVDPTRWQHAQLLSLLSAVITVDGYKASELASSCLKWLTEVLVRKWSAIRFSCVPTRAAKIFCHVGAQLSYALRFWEAVTLTGFLSDDATGLRISEILQAHSCSGLRLGEQEWRLLGRGAQLKDKRFGRRWNRLSELPAVGLLLHLPHEICEYAISPALFESESETLMRFIAEQQFKLLQNCIPLCLICLFIDLCGMAGVLEQPALYGALIDPILKKGRRHPESAVRALCAEWLASSSEVGDRADRRRRVYWRLRDRQIGRTRLTVSWRDLVGDVETTVLRPFTCPTFAHSEVSEADIYTGRDRASIHLLGCSHSGTWAKCIARDWGRCKDAAASAQLFFAVSGPWDKNGCFYAAVLSALRHNNEQGGEGGAERVTTKGELLQLGFDNAHSARECSKEMAEVGVSLGILERIKYG